MSKQENRPNNIKLYTPLPSYKRKKFNWRLLITTLIIVVLSGLAVRFFDAIHYNNIISQDSQQSNLVENNQGKDINQLISTYNGQLNCNQFSSSFARKDCQVHDQQ